MGGLGVFARKRAGLIASAAALGVLAVGVQPALATHDLYRRLSTGDIGGNAGISASFAGASTDGKRVFFTTVEKLVSADTDTVQDVYERSAGTTKLVSAGAINGNGNSPASFAGISSNGLHVFFLTAEQLVATDTDNVQDIYERFGGSTVLVSAGGNVPIGVSFNRSSVDGLRVFFSTAQQVDPADTDGRTDIYQRFGGVTTLVSAGQINGNGNFDAFFQGAAPGGGSVFFSTTEQLVASDSDASKDLYRRSSNQTIILSHGTQNGNGASDAVFSGASGDGTHVFFVTNETLVPDDTDIAQDVYQFSAGAVARVSAGAINGNGTNSAQFRGSSTDGTRVFFTTPEKLVSSDTDSVDDIYQREAGTTTRVSIGATNGNGAFAAIFAGASADGSRVLFHSQERLVATDTDSQQDVYERSSGATVRISAGRVNGNGAFDANFVGESADASRVFFTTREVLATGDGDSDVDIYEHSADGVDVVSIGDGAFPAIFSRSSDDGLAVFFVTDDKVLANDKDVTQDVYGAYAQP